MTEIRSQRLAAHHIRRIEVELRDLERSEALQQRAYGDRRAGSRSRSGSCSRDPGPARVHLARARYCYETAAEGRVCAADVGRSRRSATAGQGRAPRRDRTLGHVSAHARAPMRCGASWCVCELRGCAQALGTDAGHRAQPDATMRHARK